MSILSDRAVFYTIILQILHVLLSYFPSPKLIVILFDMSVKSCSWEELSHSAEKSCHTHSLWKWILNNNVLARFQLYAATSLWIITYWYCICNPLSISNTRQYRSLASEQEILISISYCQKYISLPKIYSRDMRPTIHCFAKTKTWRIVMQIIANDCCLRDESTWKNVKHWNTF